MTPTRRPWALLAVSLATFMTYLDNNIVNVAMPAIQRDLGLTTSGLEWVVSSYVLVFAALLLAGGRLADAFGRRRLFLVGLGVFVGASLVAGLAGSVEVLVSARAVQGLGAALVTPTTLAIISDAFRDPRERAQAVGLWAGVGALALAVGPLLGGLLAQHASWGWIFTINVPVGLATLALGAWAIRESREEVRRPLDVPGLVLSSSALTGLTWSLIEGGERGWTSSPVLGGFALAAVAGALFLLAERRSAAPMVDVALFRERAFSGGLAAMMLWAFGLFGIYFFTSLYLQDVLGFSPTEAGLAFLPMALCMVAGAVVSEQVARAVGAARLVGGAMVLMAAGIASVSLLGADTGYWQLMPSFVLIGIGGGLVTPLTATVLAVMPTSQAGIASGLFNASREVAGLLGITVIGAVLTGRQSASLRGGSAPVDAFLDGYRFGLLGAATLVALGGLAAYLALRTATPAAADDELLVPAAPVPVPAG
ncbi:MFS transporter [Blastococcus sp. URHD0036]|uniref:MFS transporter n=1 Tax=Blastococcus sp. URHD0036 TaxID=1380356 RepID=UPI0018CBF656|nr:MFS transporter [Blastococcus sp. URHD0036]